MADGLAREAGAEDESKIIVSKILNAAFMGLSLHNQQCQLSP
jgi:hypothetical protein